MNEKNEAIKEESLLDKKKIKKIKNAKSPDEISKLLENQELPDYQLNLVTGGMEWEDPGDVREDYDSEKVPSEFIQGEIDGSVVFDEE